MLSDSRVTRPLAIGVVGVLAAGMGAVWALGGFDKAPEEGPERIAPGAEIDQGAFTAKVVRAVEAGRLDPDSPEAEARKITEPQRIIRLEMRVTNLDTKVYDPMNYLGTSTHEEGEKVLIPRMKVRAGEDDYFNSYGLSVRSSDRREFYFPAQVEVGFHTEWLLPADREPPEEVTVELATYEPRGVDFYDIPDYWLPELEDDHDGPLEGSDDPRPRMAFQVVTPVEEER
ncbi:hypothetical protein CLV63_101226 [Murinocardiopsis flavida]|uniref:Uncharacterized protein n=1 Tax=Murinocardiopsis flavida TaxID=645275 RepID=A0A2P8DU53_9ACTN|nr:hypothetical protein [Murinocardiopsis flavida]PSL00750.1 hypothetical protein CLV63_101226 [Murinocardiopsis flavida]